MEKDYLAEYVVGRIHELEKELAKTREEQDRYLGELIGAREDAKAVFSLLKHNTLSGNQYYELTVWDTCDEKAYEALKHLLWLLGVADPAALKEEGIHGKNIHA